MEPIATPSGALMRAPSRIKNGAFDIWRIEDIGDDDVFNMRAINGLQRQPA